jgi:glycosyltransferase involved in cell wall biosynthesis
VANVALGGGEQVRVLIDDTYAQHAPHSGTAVYVSQLIAALSDADVVTTVNPGRGAPAGGGVGSAGNLLADRWWEEVELPRRARLLGADVIHHPLPAVTRFAGRAAVVVTVHDLAFERLPAMFDSRWRRYALLSHRAAARRADAVICVSSTTASDVQHFWGIDPDRIVVAPHGPGQALPVAERGAPQHFLYVGDDEPRKDLGTLLAAYASYRGASEADPLELVVAGSATASGEGVRVERDVDAARLGALHAGAAALVHASLYEGFGLTLLEAMRAGTPVIAARVSGVSELCGDAARLVPAGDAARFAEAMAAVGGSPELRDQLSVLGRERAARFSWARSARAHLAAYSLALNS